MFFYAISISAIVLAGIVLPLFLLRKRGHGPATWILVFTLMVTALLEICDLGALLHPARFSPWKRGSLFAEALLPGAWFAYSLTVARVGGYAHVQRLLLAAAALYPLSTLVVPVETLFFAPDFAHEHLLFLQPGGHLFYSGAVLLLILALIHLERTLFTLSGPDRWKIKFELIGAGAIIFMLFIYDGHALLYRVVDMHLVPARSAAVVIGSLLILFSRRRLGAKVEVRVSRQLAFRSVVLLLIGAYLAGLGLVEEGMRRFGEGFGRAVGWMILLAGGVTLLACLLSEKYRRKLRVLIHKNFYKSKYDYQRHWLACTQRIASARTEGELKTTILSIFCETFAAEGALLYLRDPDTERFLPGAIYETGAKAPPLERGSSLVRALGEREWILDVRQLPMPSRAEEKNLLEEHRVSFIIPLVFDGILEGMILLGEAIDTRESYIYEDFDLMKTLARQTVSTILNLRLSDQLVASREMAAAGKVSAYLLHDLKNLVGNLSLVVDNAEFHMENPEFRKDMLTTLGNMVQKMRRLMDRLKNLEEKVDLQLEPANLMEVAREAAKLVQGEVRVAGTGAIVHIDREEMLKVLLNLVLNALEADGAPVELEVGTSAEGAFVTVSDRGCGMSPEFVRNHLFRPFRTTKAGGFGIGLYQCRSIVAAHGGEIQVESTTGQGSRFTLRLPAQGGKDLSSNGGRTTPFTAPGIWPSGRSVAGTLRERFSP